MYWDTVGGEGGFMIFNGMVIDDSRLLDLITVTNSPGGARSSETLEWVLEEISYDESTSRSDLVSGSEFTKKRYRRQMTCL